MNGFLEGVPLKWNGLELRDYQVSIAKSIVEKGNSLVVMPTALGKTFVAILVIAEKLKQNPGGKVLFLTPTKPLAVQQAKRFKEILLVNEGDVAVVTGEIPSEKRKGVYESARIVSATPQTVSNDLSFFPFNCFSVIVFDECHRVVGEYAYTRIAEEARRHSNILLIGLTASPSSDKEKISEICKHLGVVNVEVRTESDADVRKYVQEVSVKWEVIELPKELKEVRSGLNEVLVEEYSKLRKFDYLGLSLKPNKKVLLLLQKRIVGVNHPSKYRVMSLIAKVLNLMHAIDLLESQGLWTLKEFLENLEKRKDDSKAVRELASDSRIQGIALKCRELIEAGVEHSKLGRLKEIVFERVNRGKSLIVFAHYRDTVKKIVEELNSMGVSARMLIGKSKEGMSQKEQVALLDSFRKKEFSVLCSTSISEEGLDVVTVDSVIFYEAVPSEIRFIQRKGRTGRIRPGEVILLIAKDTRDEANFWISKRKERKMRENLGKLREGIEFENSVCEDGQRKLNSF